MISRVSELVWIFRVILGRPAVESSGAQGGAPHHPSTVGSAEWLEQITGTWAELDLRQGTAFIRGVTSDFTP